MKKIHKTAIEILFSGTACLVAICPAFADVVVVVGAKSALGSLTVEQASQVFLGKVNSVAGTSVVPIDQAAGALRDEFYTKVTNKTSSQIAAYRANMIFSGKGQAPKEVASSADVKKAVNENPTAIGYIDKSAVDPSVKVVLSP